MHSTAAILLLEFRNVILPPQQSCGQSGRWYDEICFVGTMPPTQCSWGKARLCVFACHTLTPAPWSRTASVRSTHTGVVWWHCRHVCHTQQCSSTTAQQGAAVACGTICVHTAPRVPAELVAHQVWPPPCTLPPAVYLRCLRGFVPVSSPRTSGHAVQWWAPPTQCSRGQARLCALACHTLLEATHAMYCSALYLGSVHLSYCVDVSGFVGYYFTVATNRNRHLCEGCL